MVRQTKREIPTLNDSPTRGLSRGRRLAVILLCLCVVAVFVGIISFDKLPSTIGDNAEFAILARALASGHGFRYLNHPDLQPSTKYPPGFPLLLAMWIPLFGESMVVMKVVVLGCYVLAVVAAFLLGRKLVDERLSLVAALMIGTSASILPYSHEVLSDIPYALFSLVALLLIMDVKVGRRTLVTGLAICMWAYVVRTAGVSLVLAAALYLFLRARRKEAYALGLAFILFSALWAIRNHLVAGEGSRYVGVLLAKNPYNPDLGPVGAADLARRVWINLSAYVGGLLPLSFLPTLAGYTREAPLRALVSLVILVVAGLGCFSLRKRGLLPNLYILAYMIVYLLWPEVWRTERFMLPIAPLVAIYLVGGVQRICSYVELRRLATLVVCIAIAATNLYSLSKYATRMRGYPLGWNNYFATATWAKANTKPDAVFLCRSAFLFYVVSERKAIQYPFTADAQAMRAYLIKSHPDYIVLDSVGFPQTRTYLVPVIRTMQVMLNPVYETPEPVNAVLKFSPEGGGGN